MPGPGLDPAPSNVSRGSCGHPVKCLPTATSSQVSPPSPVVFADRKMPLHIAMLGGTFIPRLSFEDNCYQCSQEYIHAHQQTMHNPCGSRGRVSQKRDLVYAHNAQSLEHNKLIDCDSKCILVCSTNHHAPCPVCVKPGARDCVQIQKKKYAPILCVMIMSTMPPGTQTFPCSKSKRMTEDLHMSSLTRYTKLNIYHMRRKALKCVSSRWLGTTSAGEKNGVAGQVPKPRTPPTNRFGAPVQ